MLQNHEKLLTEHSIILRQWRSFCESDAPTIVDPRIKGISIVENEEPVVDLEICRLERLSMMPKPKKPFEGPLFSSRLPNASKMRKSVFFKLEDMVYHLDAIAADFGYEKGQMNILVFEGLRDLRVQKMLFEKKLKEIMLSNPSMSMEEAEKETSKWVSPVKNNIPVHSTGAAVDIRLWDNKNKCFLDLGTFGVIWRNGALAPTFSEEITDLQKSNRLFCLIAAERASLTNYVYEWWHFPTEIDMILTGKIKKRTYPFTDQLSNWFSGLFNNF